MAPSLTSHPATNNAAVAEKFEWPAPSSFEFIRSEGEQDSDECLVIFRDGAKVTGRLTDFLPYETSLKFQPAGASAVVSVAFSSVHGLRFLTPVRLKRQTFPLTLAEGNVVTPSEHQSFSVHMANEERLQGETIGFVRRDYGVFLFLPEEGAGVVRCFVPAESIQSFEIGPLIGEMLVDQRLASPEAVQAALAKQREMRAQRLGNYLTENQIVSPGELVAALKRQQTKPILKLGESLVELGFLTESELEEALRNQARNRKMPLGQILSDMGVVDREVIRFVLANKLGIPFVNLQRFTIAPEILRMVPAEIAHRHQIMPICESDGTLIVALEDPMNMAVLEQLHFKIGMKMGPVMAAAEDIRSAIERNYGNISDIFPEGATDQGRSERPIPRSAAIDVGIDELTSRLAAESGEVDVAEEQVVDTDSTLVQIVNKIILDAIRQKASDIHIESNPGRKSTRIRFRKDGTLTDYVDLPSRFRSALISRIKIMSRLDITERRKPQDGKIDFSQFGPAQVELRVATIPTTHGLEHAVLRVLAAAKPIPIDELGFDASALETVKGLLSKPHGLFLVCGPTGSGKTTTLHSLLGFINKPERKIWTAEDPIEITHPGLCQVQINAKIGWTFAAAMRSFLRADPDVIMVGEMRDAETAEIAIQASLTGHLVLSTLHTNSAAESIVRLLDLGMDPFNFADSLRGVLAQRLAKRLCPSCKTAHVLTAAELEELALEYCNEASIDTGRQIDAWLGRYAGNTGRVTIYRARGCEHCNQSGFRGRVGLYELLVADPAVKQLVQSRAPIRDVRNVAMAAGMRTLKQDGIEKILQGLTDIHQVRAVCI